MQRSSVSGSRVQKAKIAALFLLGCLAGSTSLHADDRSHTSARLQINVVVMPTLIASMEAPRLAQPSNSLVTFDLQAGRKPLTSSLSELVITAKAGERPAVLKTTTVVPE